MSVSSQGGGRVSLGDVAAKILEGKLPAAGKAAPILARRKGPERKLEEAKQAERDEATLRHAKKVLRNEAHQTLRVTASKAADLASSSLITSHRPGLSDPVLETFLKKQATRGVVQLFNAVRSAQKDFETQVRILYCTPSAS